MFYFLAFALKLTIAWNIKHFFPVNARGAGVSSLTRGAGAGGKRYPHANSETKGRRNTR